MKTTLLTVMIFGSLVFACSKQDDDPVCGFQARTGVFSDLDERNDPNNSMRKPGGDSLGRTSGGYSLNGTERKPGGDSLGRTSGGYSLNGTERKPGGDSLGRSSGGYFLNGTERKPGGDSIQ